MEYLALSENDRVRLDILQHKRLREVLNEPAITLYVDMESRLHIHCNDPAQVDRLIANPSALLLQVYWVFGVDTIWLWFAQELIWSTDELSNELPQDQELSFIDELELIQFNPDFLPEEGMTAAVVDMADLMIEAADEVLPEIIDGMVLEKHQALQKSDTKAQLIAAFKSDKFLAHLSQMIDRGLEKVSGNGNGSNGSAVETIAPPAEPETTPEPAPTAKPRRNSAAKTDRAARTTKTAKQEGKTPRRTKAKAE